MSGKKRAWIRKKIERLRQLCHKDRPATYAEDAPLIPVVSLSELPSAPQSARIRSNRSAAISSDTTRPLVRPHSGANPSSRAESVASPAPRLGRMQKTPSRRPPPELQHLNDVSEVKQRAIRHQTSTMSTNTIGWDTPIGDYAGGKQVCLHPTGLLELRRPESAARMQETEQVAGYDFRCKCQCCLCKAL